MDKITVALNARPRWWAKPALLLAVALQQLVEKHGMRVTLKDTRPSAVVVPPAPYGVKRRVVVPMPYLTNADMMRAKFEDECQ